MSDQLEVDQAKRLRRRRCRLLAVACLVVALLVLAVPLLSVLLGIEPFGEMTKPDSSN